MLAITVTLDTDPISAAAASLSPFNINFVLRLVMRLLASEEVERYTLLHSGESLRGLVTKSVIN